jgi:hypothetical protein
MSAQFNEISRAFHEFYPEPKLRHQVHYTFAHRFLPAYVQQNPFAFYSYLYDKSLSSDGSVFEPRRFIQSRWSVIFEKNCGLTPPHEMTFRRVTDLDMSLHQIGGMPAALVKMPPPEVTPEAYFVALVFFPDGAARVFTLEVLGEARNHAVVCEWAKDGAHLNLGVRSPTDAQGFLVTLDPLIQAQPAPIASYRRPADVNAPNPPP